MSCKSSFIEEYLGKVLDPNSFAFAGEVSMKEDMDLEKYRIVEGNKISELPP